MNAKGDILANEDVLKVRAGVKYTRIRTRVQPGVLAIL